MLHAVVMAGGSGTRFWPASRQAHPKQFLSLMGDQSLIQQAVARCEPLAPSERVWIVTGAAHAVETARQLPELPSEHVLVEPCGRNTAPCVGLAAAAALSEDPDAIMLVTPADHVISPNEEFIAAVQRAIATIEKNPEQLCLFGIVPDRPATGYGYIEQGNALGDESDRVFNVERFREKPDLATAEQFLAAGNFLWNSGIFVWRADTILNNLEEFQPEMFQRLSAIREHCGRPTFGEALETEFPNMPSISIDYAVLEHSKSVCVIEAPFEWDDVGSWSALPRLHAQQESGNTVVGKFIGKNTKNCTVFSNKDHLIATIGLEDCVIVHTERATLVAKMKDDAELKDLLKQIEAQGLGDHL
jgi:mannose-1-phosphate guanylyltransferase